MSDRSRKALKANRGRLANLAVGGFIMIPRELRDSPAWDALSDQGRRLLDRIEREHMRQGGKANGSLLCTYDDFERAGLRRKSVAAAIRECEVLGFLETKRHGYRSSRALQAANLYRLTYVDGAGGCTVATNEWRGLETAEQVLAAVTSLRKPRPTRQLREIVKPAAAAA